MTSSSVEEMQEELLRLLTDEAFFSDDEDSPQISELSIRAACSKACLALQPAQEDLERLRQTSDRSDRRNVLKKEKEVCKIQRIVKLIKDIETRAVSISNEGLRLQLSRIDKELLDRSGDRLHMENRIKCSACSPEHKNALKEEVKQLIESMRNNKLESFQSSHWILVSNKNSIFDHEGIPLRVVLKPCFRHLRLKFVFQSDATLTRGLAPFSRVIRVMYTSQKTIHSES
jgi:hypothetical protein